MMQSRDSEGEFQVIYDAATDSLKQVSAVTRASDSDAIVADKHPYARFFATVTAGAGGAALSAAIGSGLLDVMTHNAHDTKSIVESALVGGVALFAAYGAILFCSKAALSLKSNPWAVLTLGAGLMAFSAELGGLMMGVEDMGIDYLTASALGTVLVGGAGAVGLKAYYNNRG